MEREENENRIDIKKTYSKLFKQSIIDRLESNFVYLREDTSSDLLNACKEIATMTQSDLSMYQSKN
jgi:hypothetical protein